MIVQTSSKASGGLFVATLGQVYSSIMIRATRVSPMEKFVQGEYCQLLFLLNNIVSKAASHGR
jgi:hypothetical protein